MDFLSLQIPLVVQSIARTCHCCCVRTSLGFGVTMLHSSPGCLFVNRVVGVEVVGGVGVVVLECCARSFIAIWPNSMLFRSCLLDAWVN